MWFYDYLNPLDLFNNTGDAGNKNRPHTQKEQR